MNNFMRFLVGYGIILMLLMLTTSAAMAAWKQDTPLTFDGKPLLGNSGNTRLKWNPVTGRIGLAYIETGTNAVTYVEWQQDAGVVLKENVAATGVTCLGLGYDAKGLPHIGVLGTPDFIEYVKQPDGAWTAHDTGVKTAPGLYRGSYAWNPVTGSGAFMVVTGAAETRKQAAYLYYQEDGWRTANCGYGGIGGSSLAFTPNGKPFVVWSDDLPPTKEESVGMARRAGDATPGATAFSQISTGVSYMYMFQGAIAIDPANNEVWVSYMDTDWGIYARKWTGAGWSAPETVITGAQMNVGQLGFAVSPSHDRVAMFPTADAITGTGSSGGITMAFWDHTKNLWKTETMPFLGDPAGLDLEYDAAGNLYGLYNAFADDQFHLLSGYEPPAPLYIKVKMNDQAEPCVIHLWGLNNNGAGMVNCNLWEDGLKVDEQYTRYPEEGARYLEKNEESPWVDITPMGLSPAGDNRMEFYAMQTYPTGGSYGVQQANFTLYISSTPSDAGLLKTFTRSGAGSGMMVVIDLTKRDQIKDDLDWSRWQNDIAKALPLPAGRRPTKFPLITMCSIHPGYYRTLTVDTEIDTLTRLGFNGLNIGYAWDYDRIWDKAGFPYIGSGTNYRFPPYVIDNDRSNLDKPAIADFVKKDLKSFIDKGHLNNITYWTLYDEPSSMYMKHIVSCPVCQANFRKYLQGLGYTPKFFGCTSWDQILPSDDKVKQPKLYYHTAMFRCQILVDLFKAGTDPLKELQPQVPTTANFVEEYTTTGNMVFSGVDMFSMFEQGGLQLGWAETWLPWTSTLQLSGNVADLLRSAVDGHGTGKFGMYSMRGWGGKLYWDIAAKTVSLVGHGSSQLYHYNWGPYYGLSVDSGSQRPGWYQALQTANYAIGGVEDYLVDAKVPKSKIAILYSQATDFRSMDENYSLYGLDSVGLWIILRHIGYPVDFIQEKDIASGKLTKDQYKIVFCDAAYLLDKAMPPLAAWVKAGGMLYLGPNALMHDQYGASLGFDAQMGISRQAFVFTEQPGVATQFPGLKNLMPVTYGKETLETLCGYQKMKSTPAGATVLATFADGSPALFSRSTGKGRLMFSGFFPGLSYQKAAVITRQERDKVDPDFPSQSSTDWPSAYRTLFASLLKSVDIKLSVTTSHYLVEADRLEAPATHPGSVIALTNWTGKPVKDLKIVLPRNGMQGIPSTVIHPIKSQTTKNGLLTVTLDMNGPVDFLVVPKSIPAPVAPVKSQLAANLKAGKRQTIVAYGTSLTRFGDWVDQLQEALNGKYPGLATVINSGAGSMWSKWGVDNLDEYVINKKPDVVLIEFAINDGYLEYQTSVADARANLLNMIDRIQKANKDCEVILMTMNPSSYTIDRPNVAAYYEMYREVAKQRKLMLIDHYVNWKKILDTDLNLFYKYVSDGLHPNAEGSRMVITPAILKALEIEAAPAKAGAK